MTYRKSSELLFQTQITRRNVTTTNNYMHKEHDNYTAVGNKNITHKLLTCIDTSIMQTMSCDFGDMKDGRRAERRAESKMRDIRFVFVSNAPYMTEKPNPTCEPAEQARCVSKTCVLRVKRCLLRMVKVLTCTLSALVLAIACATVTLRSSGRNRGGANIHNTNCSGVSSTCNANTHCNVYFAQVMRVWNTVQRSPLCFCLFSSETIARIRSLTLRTQLTDPRQLYTF